MSEWSYSEEELDQYFNEPAVRDSQVSENGHDHPSPGGIRGYFHDRFDDPRKGQAAFVLSILVGTVLAGVLFLGGWLWAVSDDLPSTQSLENPTFQLATVAYTADGEELARYARQNRSWLRYDSIATPAVQALVATEDHRFHQHWGVDMQGILAAVADILTGELRGASTITQQLARNLYNEKVGREVTITRKLKEMVTAVKLERRYTKPEIIEMYLNTVSFGSNAFGIEAASRTYFGTSAKQLNVMQAATLIGLLKATTYYNPVRNPENARLRRNVVMRQMVKRDFLAAGFYEESKDKPVDAEYHSAELYASLSPYFAEYVRNWAEDWADENNRDLYADGLRIYTTLDSEMQAIAREAVEQQMSDLQRIVEYEWSERSGALLSQNVAPYREKTPGEDYEPFKHFWESKAGVVNDWIRSTDHYTSLRDQGLSEEQAIEKLKGTESFVDSLRSIRTRLESGLVSLDPRNGHVKVWIGGRDFRTDKYDKVAIARRQPGSTFKPFTYTAAIDNGYSPYDTFKDSTVVWRDEGADTTWTPQNFGGSTNQDITLSQGLARSMNTITSRLVLEINPSTVATYARRMGIQSEMQEVPSIALGTSDVTLLEMASSYATLANGGLYHEPTAVTRIEDRYGNVLYEAQPTPREALSERTAYTVVDMMRGVIDYGTGIRVRTQFGLGKYDLAGKTGTTQKSADTWFMLMHPELVTGSWVGFNDRRVTFRTNWWGQGAHSALFLVGDFYQGLMDSENVTLPKTTFPMVEDYGSEQATVDSTETSPQSDDRFGW
jgi:penicillin-binding protein 1A